MKQGNQFYLEIQIQDEQLPPNILTNEGILKVVFNIDDLTKTYAEDSEEVSYDETKQCFKIWLSEEETLKFNEEVQIEARILFETNEILGSYIKTVYFNPILIDKSILEEE